MARRIDWERRIGRRLRLRDLHVFLMVAQLGSMAKAAAHLGISQPTVSEMIADLEHAVGVRLFDRSPRGVTLTIFGQTLLRRGQIVFDELRLGINELEFLTDPSVGQVRVACTEGIAVRFLPAVVERLSERYPRVTLHVVSTSTPTLEFPELHQRDVDLVLARLIKPPLDGLLTEDLTAEVLYNDRYCLAASAASKWARRRKIVLAELLNEPWIVAPLDTPGGNSLIKAFQAQGLNPPAFTVTTFSINLRRNLSANSRFITVLPEFIMYRDAGRPFSLKVLPIELPTPRWPVAIVTLKN